MFLTMTGALMIRNNPPPQKKGRNKEEKLKDKYYKITWSKNRKIESRMHSRFCFEASRTIRCEDKS